MTESVKSFQYTGEVPEIPKFPDKESTQNSESKPLGPSDIFDDYEKPNNGNSGGNNESSGGNNESSGESTGDSEDTDTPSAPVLKELTVPANASSLTQSGMVMQRGAALHIVGDSDRPEMRFTCEITGTLYEQNSDNFKIGVLLAPQSYFDEVNVNGYTVIDWIKEFDADGKQYLTTYDTYESSRSSTGYVTQFILTNINYENINRKFAAVGFVKITNGSTVTYKYGTFETGLNYRTNARSVAYVAGAALNAQALGQASHADDQVQLLRSYVDESVDYANGLTSPVYDGSIYGIVVMCEVKPLSIGETRAISVRMQEDVEISLTFVSSDPNVLTVDSKGIVTAVGKGTASVKVYIAGRFLPVELTVE